MSKRVEIVDVSPRDGLQNECKVLPPETRLELIRLLEQAGVRSIEVGSFVHPKFVPTMANLADICRHLDFSGTQQHYTALVPNLKGFELAVTAGLNHVRLVIVASETLNGKNFKCSVEDSLKGFEQVAGISKEAGVAFGVIIGASFGCPYEGHVPPAQVIRIASRLVELGADEVMLADTTGMAMPDQVETLCGEVRDVLVKMRPGLRVGVHLHNTRNTGYANAYAAYRAGIRLFDASLGGIGGCPFSPNALGNIATEDLVHMFNGMGVETGIDLAGLLKASKWLEQQLGKPMPAMIGKAEPVYPTLTT
ncbi:hydroxymethylglutaryl-CoA lyase [Desulforhopalus singaporensis]|uniref:(R)-citramalyl-CoA lyase n=1 Tax=Desulforhopalus singaporensis TaxID=91360 RepID=A0A1H0LTH4_9BACT|nr:hydroxymethylglutaryl-CoA lyase [Desulforhopalus singaporensis]SDO71559.1 (R)-citramalyl-CoA lyase [Desulforhopalus singaporensis]